MIFFTFSPPLGASSETAARLCPIHMPMPNCPHIWHTGRPKHELKNCEKLQLHLCEQPIYKANGDYMGEEGDTVDLSVHNAPPSDPQAKECLES